MVSVLVGGLALAAAKVTAGVGAVAATAKAATGFAAVGGALKTGVGAATALGPVATINPAIAGVGTAALSGAGSGFSAAGISAGLALLGGAVTGIGSYMQQRAQSEQARAQAQIEAAQAEYAAATVRRQGEQNVTDTKRRLQRSIGATKAQVARTGLTLGGSASDILFSMNTDADEEIEDIRLATETRAYGFDTRADLASSASSQKSGSLLLSVTGGLLRSGASAVSAFNSLNPPKAQGLLSANP